MIEADDIMSLDRYELEHLEWNGVPRGSERERELVWMRNDKVQVEGLSGGVRMPG